MRHVVMYSPVCELDGLEDVPIECVEVIGIAATEGDAIAIMASHAQGQPKGIAGDRRRYAMDDVLSFVRASGPKGDDITAGFNCGMRMRTYYRAVPFP